MTTHSTNIARVVASVACTGLVIASAGFGAAYAYSIGIQHGYVLAGLTITFAVALELIKPLAISGAFQAFGTWKIGRGLALSVLGLVAVAYSLQSELSLTAASRSDLVAKRSLEGTTATTDKAKYDAAVDELRLIHPSRTVPEVDADIVRTKNLRTIAKLKGEKARTERREKLQAIVSNYRPGMAKVADPGSTAIQTYLSSVGVSVKADTLAQWLVLVPVLALEIGSALGMVLVNAMPRREPPMIVVEPPSPVHVVHPDIKLLPDLNAATRETVGQLIMNHLRTNGGSVSGSERGLAKLIGTSKPTLRRSIQSLTAAGLVLARPTKRGTELTLAR